MIKQLLVVAAIAVAVSGSAFAGGGFEPAPVVKARPAAPAATKPSPVAVAKAAKAAVVAEVTSPRTRDHALFLGAFADRPVTTWDNLDDMEFNAGYVKYSPVTTGFSPVASVVFGDTKGFEVGAGYGISNKVKPYVTVGNLGSDYFSNNSLVASVGVNVALPAGLALDLGVLSHDIKDLTETVTPFVGVGYRF